MKKLLCNLPFLAFIFLSTIVIGQENLLLKSVQEAKTRKIEFRVVSTVFAQSWDDEVMLGNFESSEEVHFLHYENSVFADLQEAVSLSIPLKTGQLQLELLEVPDSFYSYKVVTSDGQSLSANKDIKHFRGIVKGDPNSLVAISFMEDEVIGLIATDEGNFNLALDKISGRHIFYSDRNLKEKLDFQCETHGHGITDYDPEILSQASKSSISSEDVCVRFYFETEHDIFQTRGSVASVESFVAAVFNQVATLYQNENIETNAV